MEDVVTRNSDLAAKYNDVIAKYNDLSTKYTEQSGKYTDLSTKYNVFSHYHRCEIGLSGVRQQCEIFLSYTVYYYAVLKHTNQPGKLKLVWKHPQVGSDRSSTPESRHYMCIQNIQGAEITGFAGGSWYDHIGAAAEFVCLPRDPDLTSKFTSSYAFMYGSEYDTSDFGHENGDDLPCSVCRSTVHSSVLMIPGKSSCYDGWTMQYHGDLVAGEYQNRAATQYICLDEHPEALTAGQRNDNGKLFVPVKAVCGALACPPYHNDRYLTKNNDMLAKYNTLLTKSNVGGIFVRWGRKDCPGNNTELVYSGFAGGSYYSHTGATAEFVCLPRDPDLTTKFSSGYAYMYGSEYDTTEFGHADGDDLPCSVCRSTMESSVLMIPGKSSCYDGWSMQYHGDLVAGKYSHSAATQFICLDEHPEALTAGQDNHEGKLFYPVQASCGSLACPPYHNGKYLTCVVCTK
eukprot:XP_011413096.2 PREDICTED: uncharacterized protein LOC105317973 [Crassostrea gigas]